MRRRGLRDRIRHQRRLTRRLVTRHVLARRAQPAALLLDALGAWLHDDEPTGTHRFVPPLVEHDSASIVADAAPAIAGAESAYPLTSIAAESVPDIDEIDPTLAEDDIDAIDLPNARTAPWPIPEMAVPPRPVPPARRPETVERSRPAPDANDAGRVAPKPAIPASPPIAKRSPAPTLRPPAPVDHDRAARPLIPAVRHPADRPVPIVARPDSVEAQQPTSPGDIPAPSASHRTISTPRTTQGAQTSASSGAPSETEAPDTSDAAENAGLAAPNADNVLPSRESAAGAPTDRVPQSSNQAVERATAADPPAQAAERTAHSEVLKRALGALRASGELPPAKGQPAVRRQAPAPHQASPAPVAVPPARPAPAAPPSRAAVPSAVERNVVAPTAARPTPTSANLTSNDSTSDGRASRDEPVTDGSPASALAHEPGAESRPQGTTAAQSAAESSVDQLERSAQPARDPSPGTRDTTADAATTTPAIETSRPVAAPTEQPQSEVRSTLPPTGLRVDEQRQARRPAHLDRPRPDAPASTPAAAPQAARDASPPLSRGPDRANAGQFQFSDVERTAQDWQRLLFEATNPPRRGARREPARPPENRSAAKAPPPAGKPSAEPSLPRSAPPTASKAPRAPERLNQPATDATPARSSPNAGLQRPAATPPSPRTAGDGPAESVDAGERATTAPLPDAAPDARAPEPSRHARASQEERRVTPAAVADEMRSMPTEPVAPSTRRFLRPLIGIDPDSVRIHRGERAAQLADLHDADAIAVGDDVALAAGHDERDPETVALLAHELTHAARARDRRFVPPVARGGHAAAPIPPAAIGPARSGVRQTSRPSASIDAEEVIAESVESRVRAVANNQREREQTFAVTPNADLDDDSVVPLDDEPAGDAPIGAAPAPAREYSRPASKPGDTRRSPWGALPAPWEPLPATLIPSRSADTGIGSRAPVVSSDQAAPESAEVVHRAARESGSAGEEPAHADHPAQADAAPDIDALARQVYTVLKRRLAAESRRGA